MSQDHRTAEDFEVSSRGEREEVYPLVVEQTTRLLDGPLDLLSDLGNVVALLKMTFDFYWVGFYLREGNALLLRPFQGPVACSRIEIPNGVCGACVKRNETIIVADVESFPGHIACSSKTKSEIVIPLRQNGQVIGVLDVDSINENDFSLVDKGGLEAIISIIEVKYFR